MGQTGASMHSLRHSWASALATSGLPATTLARLAGHADAGFTLRVYASDQRDDEARSRVRSGGWRRKPGSVVSQVVRFRVRFERRLLASAVAPAASSSEPVHLQPEVRRKRGRSHI
jgi:hypothetical protein